MIAHPVATRSRTTRKPRNASLPGHAVVEPLSAQLAELQRLRVEYVDALSFARLLEQRIGDLERLAVAPDDGHEENG